MDKKVKKMYQSFLQSGFLGGFSKQFELDLEWLEDKLSREDMNRLENLVFQQVTKNDEMMFDGTFKYAFALFQELQNSKDVKGDEMQADEKDFDCIEGGLFERAYSHVQFSEDYKD